MPIYQDEELGPTPVRPSDESLMPWYFVWIVGYALLFLTLGGLAIKFYTLAHADRKEIHK
jgi:hypothetical protein